MKISDFVTSSKGRFVSVTFIKKDGTIRNLNGRIGVTKYLKGCTSTVDHTRYVVVYDVINHGYRSINKNTITSVRCEKLTINNNLMAAV